MESGSLRILCGLRWDHIFSEKIEGARHGCLLSLMSSQTFSRSFLQAAPEREKQRIIEQRRQYTNSIVNGFVHDLQKIAIEGKTRYVYTQNPPPTFTHEDLVAAFKLKFPDCDVSYEETWLEVNPTNRVLKKGIVIDWS